MEAGSIPLPPAAPGRFGCDGEANPQISQWIGCFLKGLSRTGLGRARQGKQGPAAGLCTLRTGWHRPGGWLGAHRGRGCCLSLPAPARPGKGAPLARDLLLLPPLGWIRGSRVRGSPSLGPTAPLVSAHSDSLPFPFPTEAERGESKPERNQGRFATRKKIKEAKPEDSNGKTLMPLRRCSAL